MATNVQDARELSGASPKELVRLLFQWTECQVIMEERGHLKYAVLYRKAARQVGMEILNRIEQGEWP